MDIQIEKKTGIKALFTKRSLPYIAGVLFLAFVLWLIFRDNSSTLKIDSESIIIADVVNGEFNDFVRVTGQVQPITTVQLSPLESGIVEKLVVEEGSMVKKGDVIVVLSNNNLNLQILESEAQLAEKENFLRNTMITMEQEKINLRKELLLLELDVVRKKRAFQQNDELYKSELLAREIWLQSKEDYELAERNKVLVLEKQKQDSIYRTIQVSQLEESLDNIRRNMMLIRARVSNLNVKSPIDGELGLLDVVLGQSLQSGAKIGQINDLSGYKVEALIDEHYIDRVRNGLDATFERQNVQFDMKIRKVYPEVRNGQFKADFTFVGTRPENIRTGQTYYLSLQLGQPTQAITIPRGSFYQKTGGSWIYVVSEDGTKANKREIRVGRQNPQYYEILEGLQAGEKVIVSSYDSYGDNDVLILK